MIVGQLENTTGFGDDNVGHDEKEDTVAIEKASEISDEGVLGASFEASEQVVARNILVEKFRKAGERKRRVQKTSKTVKYLHETFSAFQALWEDCQVNDSAF